MNDHEAHELDRLERGRPLTEAEIGCYLADYQTPLRHGTARVGDEIAEQLRDRLRDVNAAATRGEHEPGEPHRYRLECEVCGQLGVVRLTVDPETAGAAMTPAALAGELGRLLAERDRLLAAGVDPSELEVPER